MVENANPLDKYYRQASIYITLPSGGRYYGSDVLEPTKSGELPVFPMTAKDEISFKTPDAMINGQATVDVIQSCIPNIKDAWQIVNYDLDAVLLAIRIATYGETMDITTTIPKINEEVTHAVNLPAMLDTIKNIDIKDSFTTKNGFEVGVKPLTYRDITNIQIKTFEQQKTVSTVRMSQLTEEEKTQRYAESYKKLTELNFDMLSTSFSYIKTPAGEQVENPAHIKSFLENTNSQTVNEIQDGMINLRAQVAIKPMQLKSTEEQIKKGAPATFEVPLTFDNSNFFV